MEEVLGPGHDPLEAGGTPLCTLGLAITNNEARLADVETMLVQEGEEVHEGHDPGVGRISSLVGWDTSCWDVI